MTIYSTEPINYAAANVVGGVFLGDVGMAGGDFSIIDGDTSRRKVNVE